MEREPRRRSTDGAEGGPSRPLSLDCAPLLLDLKLQSGVERGVALRDGKGDEEEKQRWRLTGAHSWDSNGWWWRSSITSMGRQKRKNGSRWWWLNVVTSHPVFNFNLLGHTLSAKWHVGGPMGWLVGCATPLPFVVPFSPFSFLLFFFLSRVTTLNPTLCPRVINPEYWGSSIQVTNCHPKEVYPLRTPFFSNVDRHPLTMFLDPEFW